MSARSVQIIDCKRNAAKVDALSRGLIVSSIIENLLHIGALYMASVVVKGLSNNSTCEMLVRGGPLVSHGGFRMEAAGTVDIEVFESPTVTAPGTSVPLVARNRIILGTPGLTVFDTPTLTADGTSLFSEILPRAGERLLSGLLADEIIMAPNTDYLLRLSNTSGGQYRYRGSNGLF